MPREQGGSVSEEAVDVLAERQAKRLRQNWGHADVRHNRRAQARRDLQAAYPAILTDIRERLLSDEVLDAAVQGWFDGRYNRGEVVQTEARQVKAAIEAALDTLTPKDGDRE